MGQGICMKNQLKMDTLPITIGQMKTVFWAEQKEGLRTTFFTRVAKSTLSSNKNTGYPIFLRKYVLNT